MKRLLCLIAALLMLAVPAQAEPEELAAALAAELLPGYAFLDGVQFDEMAMLLLEDANGRTFFAGCVRDGEGWSVTLSTAFPEWTSVDLDTFHAGEGGIRVWLYLPEEYRAYEDSDWLGAVIDLLEDGTWRVSVVQTGRDVIAFYRQSIYNDLGYEFFGDVTIPLDMDKVDWTMLPQSFHQAMALMDVSRWMLVAVQYAPLFAAPDPESAIITLGAPGAPVQVVSAAEGMMEVQYIGSGEKGWMYEDHLIPGSEQVARYDLWWWEDSNAYGARSIILDDSAPPVSWYVTAHDDSTAMPFIVEHVEYVTVLGWCPDACCYHLYSQTLGASSYVPMDQLPYTLE